MPETEILGLLRSGAASVVIVEEAGLYPPEGDEPLAELRHLQRVVNRSTAILWSLDATGQPTSKTYAEAVEGYVDLSGGAPRHGFGWDASFRNVATGRTYEQDAAQGLKNSARDLVFARIARDRLHFERPVDLAFRPLGNERLVDFGRSARGHLLSVPWLRTDAFAGSLVSRLLRHALAGGVFYRSSQSRRERNYWLPGLNGGVPLVPKKDDIHEVTFQFHDLMHAVMPDLVYDGSEARGHRRTYVLHRMVGEAVSLVLADYAFVDTLARSGADYDFAKRRIHPLFASLDADAGTPEGLRTLAHANMRFAVLGDVCAFQALGAEPQALADYRDKYGRFFTEDYAWTVRNFEHMTSERALFDGWRRKVVPALRLVGIETVRSFADALRDANGDVPVAQMDLEQAAEATFAACWKRFVEPALLGRSSLPFDAPGFDEDLARSQAFRRWLVGQSVMYERYAHVPGIAAMGIRILDRANDSAAFDEDEIARLRGFHELAVDQLGRFSAVSAEEVRLFREVVPMFEPVFAFYDAKDAAPTTVAEAAQRAFA